MLARSDVQVVTAVKLQAPATMPSTAGRQAAGGGAGIMSYTC
jgi:hypothetical protein